MGEYIRRRQFLRASGMVGTVALSGCSDNNSDMQDSDPTVTPDDDSREFTKLAAEDGDGADQFGFSVAINDSTIVVGAVNDEEPNGVQAGSAYVFTKENDAWEQQSKLVPKDGEGGDGFGGSVAVSGDTVFVTAGQGEGNPSSIYTFELSDDGWKQSSKLVPDSGMGYFPVTFTGKMVLAGSPCRGTTSSGFTSGHVYEFQQSDGSWEQAGRILPENSESVECFGDSVDGLDTTVAVRALSKDVPMDGTERSGVVHVFEKSNGNWSQTMRLTPDQRSFYFGQNIAVGDKIVAINSLERPGPSEPELGIIYVFRREDGTKLAKLSIEGFTKIPTPAIIGERVLFGDWFNNVIYEFAASDRTWNIQAELAPSDIDSRDEFGSSIAVDGATAVIGARIDNDPNGDRAGSAYVISV